MGETLVQVSFEDAGRLGGGGNDSVELMHPRVESVGVTRKRVSISKITLYDGARFIDTRKDCFRLLDQEKVVFDNCFFDLCTLLSR